MKAATIRTFGDVDVLNLEQLDVPEPADGEVLVKVLAVGVNYYDTLVRSGAVNDQLPLPHVMGSDVVGEVAALGAGVDGFEIGQRVIVAPGFPGDPKEWDIDPENLAPSYFPTGTIGWGGYAQYMRVNARWLVADPTGLPAESLAALPLVLTTAMRAVKVNGEVKPGQKVLVHAGASGSGSMAIQVAKALGAEVITTVGSEAKAELARTLGADATVLYKEERFADAVARWTGGAGVDAVLDNLGGSAMPDNLESLRNGGIVVNYGLLSGARAEIPALFPFFKNQRQIRGSWMGTVSDLEAGLDLVKARKVRPVLDAALPLDDVREAHRRIAANAVRGKLVLLPWAA
ncbi:MAG: zinc-binding dehydrogenase [Alphaproteobacteria bacterium]|nr:zinc-binding dehydrogenase [Alphaproteobacteria bacterium]